MQMIRDQSTRMKSLVLRDASAACGKSRNRHADRVIRSLVVAIILLAFGTADVGGKRPIDTQFKYAGGTEQMQIGCEGNLELSSDALTFRCASGSISAPYSSISLMQYRTDISPQVLKMNLGWKVKPKLKHSKRNRYFTVVYHEGGSARAVVFDVTPQVIQPYFAEIDLKSGKRVEVQSHEEYYQ
jgi:hypothetical protein